MYFCIAQNSALACKKNQQLPLCVLCILRLFGVGIFFYNFFFTHIWDHSKPMSLKNLILQFCRRITFFLQHMGAKRIEIDVEVKAIFPQKILWDMTKIQIMEESWSHRPYNFKLVLGCLKNSPTTPFLSIAIIWSNTHHQKHLNNKALHGNGARDNISE